MKGIIIFSLIILIGGIALVYGMPKLDEDELAMKIHEAVNKIREEYNKPALIYDPNLSRTAKLHSEDMKENHYFDHVSPDGKTVDDRIREQGIYCNVGENIVKHNIYTNYGVLLAPLITDKIASDIVELWLESEEHRDNILGNYQKEGIGVSITLDGWAYVTQNLC